jgi:chromosome partitioning protein
MLLTLQNLQKISFMTKVSSTGKKLRKHETAMTDAIAEQSGLESGMVAPALAIEGIDIALDEIRDIEQRSYRVIERLRETVFEPGKQKRLKIGFSISEAARMIGRTPTAIRDAEKAGRLPEPRKDSHGRRLGYTLTDINIMRREFETLPWRDGSDEPLVLAVSNFKGGVGKSTLVAHVAQYLALRGYRVCAIDCDPQGSLTSLFGFNPDYELDAQNTLFPFLMRERDTLKYALRPTYWDQLSLIPANLSLYSIEYQLAARLPTNPLMLERLRLGIDTIKDGFDVIIIDPPPALGMLSLSVVRAATALVVPVRPATVDFGSTAHFFTLLVEAIETLAARGLQPRYKFLKVLINAMDETKSAHTEITRMMRQVYQTAMFNTVMKDSAEIDNAGARLMSVYELEAATTSRETYRRCKAYLDAVNREIELLIRKTWPSHHEALRREGVI